MHSLREQTRKRKARITFFSIFVTLTAQRDQHNNGKTPKEAHKQEKRNRANTHTIKPVQSQKFQRTRILVTNENPGIKYLDQWDCLN